MFGRKKVVESGVTYEPVFTNDYFLNKAKEMCLGC